MDKLGFKILRSNVRCAESSASLSLCFPKWCCRLGSWRRFADVFPFHLVVGWVMANVRERQFRKWLDDLRSNSNCGLILIPLWIYFQQYSVFTSWPRRKRLVWAKEVSWASETVIPLTCVCCPSKANSYPVTLFDRPALLHLCQSGGLWCL